MLASVGDRASNPNLSIYDVIVPLTGLVAATALTILLILVSGRMIYVMTSAIAAFSCLLWLLIKNKATVEYKETSKFGPMLLTILFLITLSASILVFALRENLYVRPTGYFILTALMAAIVGLQIYLLPPSRSGQVAVLVEVIVIAMSLDFSQLQLYPTVVGLDPWWHQWFTSQITSTGHIPLGSNYSALPIFHIVVASTSLVGGLDYKLSTMLSVNIAQIIIDVVVVYLIGRTVVGQKSGLLAALLLATSNYHILFGFWTIPTTLAGTLVMLVVYAVIRKQSQTRFSFALIITVLMVALIMTHTIGAVGMAVALFVIWGSFRQVHQSGRYPLKTGSSISIKLPILFTVVMFAWWAYASSETMGSLANLLQWGFSKEYFFQGPHIQLGVAPFMEQFSTNFGTTVFFALSLVGFFYMVSKRYGDARKLALGVSGMAFLTLPYLSQISGHSVLEPRWLYLAEGLLSVPLALSLMLLCNSTKRKWLRGATICSVMFILTFSMITTGISNMDNRLLSPTLSTRDALETSELEAGHYVGEIMSSEIRTDFYYYIALNFQGLSALPIDAELSSGTFSKTSGDLILIRSVLANDAVTVAYGSIRLNYDPNDRLDQEGFSRVFSCGSVEGYSWNS